MRVWLVGSEGYIGRHLKTYWDRSNVTVETISSSANPWISPDGDIIRVPDLKSEDRIIYLAQSPYYREGIKRWDHLVKVNALAPFRLAQEAIKRGCGQFVYFSTGSIYKASRHPLTEKAELNRENAYSLSKIFAEESLNLLKDNIPICILRPFTVFGPSQRDKLIPNLAKSIASSTPIKLQRFEGEAEEVVEGLKLSLIHISDICTSVEKILEKKVVGTFNLASEDFLSIREISHLIGNKLAYAPRFEIAPSAREGDLIAYTDNFYKASGLRFNNARELLVDAISPPIK